MVRDTVQFCSSGDLNSAFSPKEIASLQCTQRCLLHPNESIRRRERCCGGWGPELCFPLSLTAVGSSRGSMVSLQPCSSSSHGKKTASPLCAHRIVFILPDTDGQQPFDTLNVVCGENIGVPSLVCINCIFFSPLT